MEHSQEVVCDTVQLSCSTHVWIETLLFFQVYQHELGYSRSIAEAGEAH